VAAFTALALGLSALGTTMNVVGQVKAGRAAKKAGAAADEASRAAGLHAQEAAESQAGIYDYNAQVATLQATDAISRGAEEESRFRAGVRGMIGSQRAGIAASNVDVGFGSAVDVQADAAFLGELDALTVRTNAKREAWGYQVQAEDLRRHAQIARKEGAYAAATGAVEGAAYREAGNAASNASKWNAASTIVVGGTSLLAQRYGFGGGGGRTTKGYSPSMTYAGRY
jgi:hypothetical protein